VLHESFGKVLEQRFEATDMGEEELENEEDARLWAFSTLSCTSTCHAVRLLLPGYLLLERLLM